MPANPHEAPPGSGDRRARPPESYAWPLIATGIVIIPQVLIPVHDRVGPPLVVPMVEAVGFTVMVGVAAKPGPVPPRVRPVVLFLFALLIVANAGAAGRLVYLVLDGGKVDGQALSASRLLVAGSLVLTTNVVTFGLFFWQVDGGGPSGRVLQPAPYPDFQFPQTGTSGLSAPGWQPRFADYLYLAFTNVVAFSPTDTLPLTIRAKALMALQSLVSVAVLVVVLSRVINILPA